MNTNTNFQLTDFEPSSHFIQRANERFGIPTGIGDIKKFLKDHSPVYNTGIMSFNGSIQTRSKDGSIFVLNQDTMKLITTYKGVSPQIGESIQQKFNSEITTLVNKYQLTTAQKYLKDISSEIEQFIQSSQAVMNNDVSELSVESLNNVYKNIAVIKTTLNMLTKQNEYYQNHLLSLLNNDTLQNQKTISIPTTETVETPTEPVKKQEINHPTDYKPRIANKTILNNDKPLIDFLDGQLKLKINNKLAKLGYAPLASKVLKDIKANITKNDLMKKIKPQMKLIDYNNFHSYLNQELSKLNN